MTTYTFLFPETETKNARVTDRLDAQESETIHGVAFSPDARNDGAYDDRFSEPITVRLYWPKRGNGMGAVSANVWIRTADGRHYSGRGSAGGCGYCKASAAVDVALRSAGIVVLNERGEKASLHGIGMETIRQVLLQLGRACGYPNFYVTR